MMIWIPIITGIIIGLAILGITFLLKKMFNSKGILFLPAIVSMLGATYMIYYGLVVIRGFEGAAYLFIVFPVYLCAIGAIVYATKNKNTQSNNYF
ncbi:YesK family protein [Ectobacillus panaciterrae]|uniref:YesK family protein n=1 Tax=Ectobacillus panaciterrae TaxID=363872 RepID=UPI00040DAB26